MFKIREKYICAKTADPELCEDGLYIDKNIIAVIDGVTAKSDFQWNNCSSGKYAMKIISEKLKNGINTDSAYAFFTELDNAIHTAAQSNPEHTINDIPRASIIAFISEKSEIWSYGDCACIVSGVCHSHTKTIDTLLSEKRSAIIKKYLSESSDSGKNVDLSVFDPGRNEILDDIKKQFNYENKHIIKDGTDLGYPVLNGNGICSDMIKTYKVPQNSSVILASDGYPILKSTLCESENELERIIRQDPYCYNEYKSTKGLKRGNVSFDDRTYIRFEVE